MSSRWILFGYKMEYDKYIVIPDEAKTVVRIFESYINGMTLKAIADELTSEHIPYKEDKTTWNKNMIARIIENAHYAGDSDYPQIVSNEMFETALKHKNSLGGKRDKDSAEIKCLKSVLYCSSCGGRIRRSGRKSRHEKWSCENNCKMGRYFDDRVLFNDIQTLIETAAANIELLNTPFIENIYEPNLETIRQEKEIRYMLDQSDIQFNTIKKAILDCTRSKFDCCVLDKAVYTEPLKEYIQVYETNSDLDIQLLDLIVERILINSDGSITIKLINGKEINSMERNGAENAGSENSNKN
ncbi:MAG: recombinase family protein [Faecalibacterium sp.]|nr:recombinase family protein [Ruminococcus sp.]MCM1393142.1 recombinase family protein [Ruminococcus sp.]MCM1484614.1 recombinase family protein [Faecalibacterium sp.]